jgi:hypothetical protein
MDLGIALIELLSAVADALSEMQDAVTNEAYLGTGRRRRSIFSHRRLLNYQMLGIGAVGIAAYILIRRHCRQQQLALTNGR